MELEMTSPFKVTFISHKSGNFDDYYFEISGIFVDNFNTNILLEVLNSPNSKYGDSGFNLSGNGFAGYRLSLRILKQTSLFTEQEITQDIVSVIDKVHEKLKKL